MHGHLQLALCMAARWQKVLGAAFEAVFLCGDVGTFTSEAQLDSATRRHAKANPCELEFLYQWSVQPQSPWLKQIFQSVEEGGLGLCCPVVMVHGNHEGFSHLEKLAPGPIPQVPLPISALPTVDTGSHIRYLPSGWRCSTISERVVAGIGGIERGQRHADYHPMAYLDEEAIFHLLDAALSDILITHQGPSALQGESGSPTLDVLLEAEIARVWFHGHSIPNREIVSAGPNSATLVVPLGDVAFSEKGQDMDAPGEEGWASITFANALKLPNVRRERPAFWRDYRWKKWRRLPDGQLFCPDLAVL